MSPRPKKPRTCACPHRPPGSSVFKPAGMPLKDLEPVLLQQDELEALRLCNGEDLTQEETGQRMGVSRGTVQRLVASGRKKLIGAIVSGRALIVEPMETRGIAMEELRRAARQQHEEGDLPEDLLGEILETLDRVEPDTVDEQLLQQLIEQVRDYDSYAGAGCFSISFGPDDIRRNLRKLLP